MTNLQSAPRPDTSDMAAVHKVFRQAFAAVPQLIGGAPAGDTDRSGVVASYYDNVLRFLLVHHQGEDVLVYPKLLERCPGDTALLSRVNHQHEEVHDSLERAGKLLPAWAESADPAAGAELIGALNELAEILIAHLDDEEVEVVPLCTDHLTAEEWGQLPGHSLASFDGDKIWLILGLVRENLTQEQRDLMMANMPPPAVEMWTAMGNAAFDAFIAEVRRPLAP